MTDEEIKNKPDFNLSNIGVWEYKDLQGNVIAYVEKLPPTGTNAKKTFIPYTFQNNCWVKKWFRDSNGKAFVRPLYGLHKLMLHPSKPVLLVEGEKAADLGSELFPDYNVLAWMGGTSVVPLNVDFEPLHNKDVTLWPDNDKPGFDAMIKIANFLLKSVKLLRTINPELLESYAEKWDLGKVATDDMSTIIDELRVILESSLTIELSPLNIEIHDLPYLSEKGRPLNHVANVEYMLGFTKKTIKYNLMSDEIEILDPTTDYGMANNYNCHINDISGWCVIKNIPKVDLHSHIEYIADKNRYHPVIDWIRNKPWDGKDRLLSDTGFLSVITAEDQAMASRLLFRWMIGAVAAAYSENGLALPGVLVLQGAQGIGKTTFVRNLVSPENEKFVKTGMILNPADKDSVLRVRSCWITELGEVGATFKSDNAKLKAFFTDSKDDVRRPYDRKATILPRRTAFIATVNENDFLRDTTGNRRFWTIAAKSINYNHGLDMQQVWAQIKWLIDEKNEPFVPTSEEMNYINDNNENFEPIDPMEEQILASYAWDEPFRNNPKTASQVLDDMGYDITGFHATALSRKCAAFLIKITGKQLRKSNGKKIWDLPRKIPNYYPH